MYYYSGLALIPSADRRIINKSGIWHVEKLSQKDDTRGGSTKKGVLIPHTIKAKPGGSFTIATGPL